MRRKRQETGWNKITKNNNYNNNVAHQMHTTQSVCNSCNNNNSRQSLSWYPSPGLTLLPLHQHHMKRVVRKELHVCVCLLPQLLRSSSPQQTRSHLPHERNDKKITCPLMQQCYVKVLSVCVLSGKDSLHHSTA